MFELAPVEIVGSLLEAVTDDLDVVLQGERRIEVAIIKSWLRHVSNSLRNLTDIRTRRSHSAAAERDDLALEHMPEPGAVALCALGAINNSVANPALVTPLSVAHRCLCGRGYATSFAGLF